MSARRLLIIDDEPDFGMSIRRIAERLGFEVKVTTRARDFMNGYREFDPTVIMMDIVMPDADGIELIRWLGSMACKASVIIISGSAPIYAITAETIGKANGLPSVLRLEKPVTMATLAAVLDTLGMPA